MLRVVLALAAAGLCTAMPAAGSQKRVVHRVTPSSEAELQALLALGIDDADLDWWRLPSVVGRPVDVLVAPGSAAEKAFRATTYTNATVMIDDLDAVIATERAEQAAARKRSPIEKLHPRAAPEFYLNYDEIIAYMFMKAEEYPDICTVTEIGASDE
jgi:hypothetical protein